MNQCSTENTTIIRTTIINMHNMYISIIRTIIIIIIIIISSSSSSIMSIIVRLRDALRRHPRLGQGQLR